MHAECQECGHHFAIGPDEVVHGACPDCGAAQSFYRLTPTPVQGEMVPFRDGVSDGEKDSGGNPLGEGVIMGKDGERPLGKRDNWMGKVAGADPWGLGDAREPTHSFVVAPTGYVYSLPYPASHERVASTHGLLSQDFPRGTSAGHVFDDGSTDFLYHSSGFDPTTLQEVLGHHFGRAVTVDPGLKGLTSEQRWRQPVQPPRRELEVLQGPAAPRDWGVPQDREGLVRGGSRTLDTEPYPSLWHHEAAVPPAVEFASGPDANVPMHTAQATPAATGIHFAPISVLRKFDAHIDGVPVRGNEDQIFSRYGRSTSPDFGRPVTVAVHHPSHLPAVVDTIERMTGRGPTPQTVETARAIMAGRLPAPPPLDGVELGPIPLDAAPARTAAVVPEIAAGAADLLGAGGAAVGVPGAAGLEGAGAAGLDAASAGTDAAINGAEDVASAAGHGVGDAARGIWDGAKGLLSGGTKGIGAIAGPLMTGLRGISILHGAGDVLHGAEDALGLGGGGSSPDPGGLAGQEPLSLGQLSHVYADYQTPSSNPSVGTDHDSPEQVDQHEFNDGDLQNNLYNPNLQDSGASGEDAVRQNAGFAPDSPALERLQLLHPLALHYLHNPNEDAFADPVIRGLHEALEAENPGYSDAAHAGHVHHLMEALKHHSRQPMGVVAAAPPMDPNDPGMAGPPTPPPPAPNPISGGQGPQTPEQTAAVQQWLIKHHRLAEVPLVVTDPNNPAFVKILDEIQNQTQISAPPVDPTEVTPPTPPPGPGGGMPMPDPSGGGGMPMQPMASTRTSNQYIERRGDEWVVLQKGTGKVLSTHDSEEQAEASFRAMMAYKHGADSVARRCPRCNSGTTGIISEDGDTFCHSCGNRWREPLIKDDVASGDRKSAAVTPKHEDHQRDLGRMLDRATPQGQPSTGQFVDVDGQPLEEGQEYEMKNPSYTIPDTIKILRVKPDGLLVAIQGVFANDPSTPQIEDPRPIPISRDDVDSQGLTFEPVGRDADDMSQEPPSGTPGYGQVPPSGQTTDEYDGSFPTRSSSVAPRDECRECGSRSITSSMSSPTTTMFDCYRCGSSWEVAEQFDGEASGLDWILSNDASHDDFFAGYERARAMQEAGMGSRDIRSIAANDPRAQEIKAALDRNRAERAEHLAGRKFSPREKRELIDEDGVARNADRLDLRDTHYAIRGDLGPRGRGADASRVPDSHLLLGI